MVNKKLSLATVAPTIHVGTLTLNHLAVGYPSGDLEDDAATDLDRMVGESLIEPAQQRDIDSRCDGVLPLPVHQHTEQMTVQIVHRIIFAINLCGLLGIA